MNTESASSNPYVLPHSAHGNLPFPATIVVDNGRVCAAQTREHLRIPALGVS
jgi:hypothetical protein